MSSVFAGPPFVVDGPFPVSPPHSLIKVATRVEDADPHWRNGAQVWGYNCEAPNAIAPCLTGTFAEKQGEGDIRIPEFGAFTAYLPIVCTARSIGNDAEFIQRAVDVFTAVESLAVEREFAMGDQQPLNPFLADANVDTPLGVGAIDPIDALAALEDEIGESGKAGLIHVSPAIAVALAAQYLVEERSGGLWTLRGTRVVVGDGYIGATPGAAPAAGTGWMFATGPVAYRSGEVVIVPGSLSEALDRATNTVTFLAERDYLVYWDTCVQSAVLVDYDACCGGGGGGGGGDASAANQLTEIAALQAIEACTCERGQEVSAASFPVVIASDQSPVAVGGDLLASLVDFQSTSTAPTHTSPTGTGADITIQASNGAREGLTIYNSSGVTVNVRLGAAATSTDFTIQLAALSYYEMPRPIYTGDVHAIWASGDIQVEELT